MDREMNLPCLICGDNVPSSSVEGGDILILTRKSKDDPIFQCFLKLFKVYDFEEKDEAEDNFKFCGSCNHNLGNLLELQIKLDQLRKQIANGVENVKEKMETKEGIFESGEIYKTYPRYKIIRSQIINEGLQDSLTSTTTAQRSRFKVPVAVTNQQKLALQTILKHKLNVNLSLDPAASSPPSFNHVDLDSSENDLKKKPQKPRKFMEYPEKQLLIYGDFRFQLIESSTDLADGMEGQGQVKCTICDLSMPYKKDLIRSHVDKLHTDRFVCPHCSSRFPRALKLRIHLQRMHNGVPQKIKLVECKICRKPIESCYRVQHEWSHKSKEEREEALKDPNLAGEVPKRSMKSLKRREEERNRELLERKKLCPECGKMFLNVQLHLSQKHGIRDGGRRRGGGAMKICGEPGCGKGFASWSMLTRHKDQVHRKLKPFQCTQCGKCFGDKWNLKQHVNGVHQDKIV